MKFCQCGKMFDMFDNIEERILYYSCSNCDIKIPFETNVIYTQNNFKKNKKWNKYDKSLPLSDKKCYKCSGNVVYEKNLDLTLRYFCIECNEDWY